MKSVAPKLRATASLAGLVSTTIMRLAPPILQPCTALRPTPPAPNTTAVPPGCMSAVRNTDPTPVVTAQAMQQHKSGLASWRTFRIWLSCTRLYSEKLPIPMKFINFLPPREKGDARAGLKEAGSSTQKLPRPDLQ